MDAIEVLESHKIELDIGSIEFDAELVVQAIDARQDLGLHKESKDRADYDLTAALAPLSNIRVLPHVKDINEHMPNWLHYYENPARF